MSTAINTAILFNSQNMQLDKAANILNRIPIISDKDKEDESKKDDPYKVDIKGNIIEETQSSEDGNSGNSIEEYFKKINELMTNVSSIDTRLESIIEIINRLNEISKIARHEGDDENKPFALSENITKQLGGKAVSLTQKEILKQYDEAVLSNTNTTEQKALLLLV